MSDTLARRWETTKKTVPARARKVAVVTGRFMLQGAVWMIVGIAKAIAYVYISLVMTLLVLYFLLQSLVSVLN